MRETGVFDQYAQELISASYGALSLSADVAVLPEVLLPYESAADDFTYYEGPTLQVFASAHQLCLSLLPLACPCLPCLPACMHALTQRSPSPPPPAPAPGRPSPTPASAPG